MASTTTNPDSASTGTSVEPAPTPLSLAVPGVKLLIHAGACTPAVFDSLSKEVDALFSSAGIFDLGWRAKVRVTGADRVRWLNGMATNAVRALAENKANYSFFLSPQGRIQGDGYIYRQQESLILDTGRDQVPALLRHLKHYIIMDEVELEDVSGQLTAFALAGPAAPRILASLGVDLSPFTPDDAPDIVAARIEGIEVLVIHAHHVLVPHYELWFPPAEARTIWEKLQSAGAIPVGLEAAETLRVIEAIPLYGVDIGDRDLPQETNQMRALNFNKGCYLGQEIVERIRSRGKVHRGFHRFSLDGAIPSLPFDLSNAGGTVGRITSAASVSHPLLSGKFALGSIREEALADKGEIRYTEGTATLVSAPPSLPKAASKAERENHA